MTGLRIYFAPDFSRDNPYQYNLSRELQQQGIKVIGLPLEINSLLKLFIKRSNVLHLHWPDYYFLRSSLWLSWSRAFYFYVVLRILKLRGIRIIWTVHNMQSHEIKHSRIEDWFMKSFSKLARHLIVHCESARDLLQKIHGDTVAAKISVIPHGNYLSNYTRFYNQKEARLNLCVDTNAFTYLFLGQIRPYKGISELLSAFCKTENCNSILLVAGLVKNTHFRNKLKQAISGQQRIILHPKYISDDLVPLYFAAADVVVFPYRNVLTSGGVVLAMSLGKPCIAPRMGCIPETLGKEGGFLYDPEDQHGLYKAIVKANLESDRLQQMGQRNADLASMWNWQNIAQQTYALYTS